MGPGHRDVVVLRAETRAAPLRGGRNVPNTSSNVTNWLLRDPQDYGLGLGLGGGGDSPSPAAPGPETVTIAAAAEVPGSGLDSESVVRAGAGSGSRLAGPGAACADAVAAGRLGSGPLAPPCF